MFVPVGWNLLLCSGLQKPCSSHPSLAQGVPAAAQWALPHMSLPETPLKGVQGGNRTWFICCCASTSSAHKIQQETELLFTFVKAAAIAAIKCCRGHNLRLVHGPPSPSGIGKSMLGVLVWNGFLQYRQSYLPVIVLPKKCAFLKFILPTSMVFPPK